MSDGGIVGFKSPPVSLHSTTSPCIFKGRHTKGINTMKDEKKVKAAEEEAKKEVQREEEGVQLTDEEMKQVAGGTEWFWTFEKI